MGNIIPKSGSAYYYLKEIFGDCVAFVYMFTLIFFALPASRAIVGLTCAEYLSALFFNDGCGSSPSNITKALATAIISKVYYIISEIGYLGIVLCASPTNKI